MVDIEALIGGSVFAVFDAQDSGNVSYGVDVGGQKYFVKTAGDPAGDHPVRVAWLRNAIEVARSCTHRCLPALRRVIESSAGPLLVYDWIAGELLGAPHAQRDDPTSAYHRFRALPSVRHVLDDIFDAHRVLAATGWIASDFYDGCLIYDFATAQLGIVDLDHYRRGPFVNEIGRMFGSTRFMAPEEYERGATIDERTTVFTLGRSVLVLWSDNDGAFRGPRAALEVAQRACNPVRAQRFASVAELCAAWQAV